METAAAAAMEVRHFGASGFGVGGGGIVGLAFKALGIEILGVGSCRALGFCDWGFRCWSCVLDSGFRVLGFMEADSPLFPACDPEVSLKKLNRS